MTRPSLRHLSNSILGALLCAACTACQPASDSKAKDPDRSGSEGGQGGSQAGASGQGQGGTGQSGSGSGPTGSGGTGGSSGATAGAGGSSGPGMPSDPIDPPPPSDEPKPDASTPPEGNASAPPPAADKASQACGKGLEAPAEGIHTIMAADINRRFFLRVPDSYDGKKAWPVIFAFHGAGNKDATWFDTNLGFRAANEDKAVLVFPESLTNNGNHTWMTQSQHPANLAYVDAMVAWVKEKLCVDPTRIFATGQSSGAYFSQTMGCQRGELFRAVASNSGGERYFENCQGNPGVLISFGRQDEASHTTAARKARDFWVQRKACTPADPKPVDPSPCVAYQGCKDEIPLIYCEHGGGHAWPGYANQAFWNFFDSFK